MHPVNRSTLIYLSIIPVFSLVWSLIVQHISGPFFLSRSDPEYVYLLNGLNAALLEFDRIGHVDHPGTPFQILTGLFIRIVFWISGEDGVLKDLISDPEKYLTWSSFFLAVLTSVILFRHSMLVYRYTGKTTGALILPFAVCFLYIVLTDLPSRYIPDRLQMMVLLIFSNVYIRFYYKDFSEKQFSVRSGILMGLGLTAKINFLPFLLLPIFLIKKIRSRVLYGISLTVTILLMLVPIHDKFNYFWQFAVGIFKHDSLYGSGESQVIDPTVFFKNILLVFTDNLPFLLFYLFALGLVVRMLIRKQIRSEHRDVFRLLTGLLIVFFVGILMVAKHYKNYYMIPVLSASALGYLILWSYLSAQSRIQRFLPAATGILGLFFFVWILKPMVAMYSSRIDYRHEELATHQAIQNNVSPGDYLLVEPTWMAGPMQENGLVYGNSYIAHRFYFYNAYEPVYPNVLTYEGNEQPLWHMRLIPGDNEAILKSGRSIYLLSTPGRNANGIMDYLNNQGSIFSVQLKSECIYTNYALDRKIYKIQNTSGWLNLRTIRCGFEQVQNEQVYTDDGLFSLAGGFQRTDKKAAGGQYALVLDAQRSKSPVMVFDNVHKDDFFSITVKRSRSPEAEQGFLIAEYEESGSGTVRLQENKKIVGIHSDWELVRLNLTVTGQPADSTLKCFYLWQGKEPQFIDDLTVEHDSK
jgi:hypothetical protein